MNSKVQKFQKPVVSVETVITRKEIITTQNPQKTKNNTREVYQTTQKK